MLAISVKPVLEVLGGLNRFSAATALIADAVPADRAGRDGGHVAAALCAAATGNLDAATRYECLPEDPRDAFSILVTLAPRADAGCRALPGSRSTRTVSRRARWT